MSAKPDTVKWTNTRPTSDKLGWYWHRFSESHKACVLEVFIDYDRWEGELSVRTGDGIDDVNFLENYCDKGTQWAGPIPQPK